VPDHVDLYDQDFLAWTREQAARLRQAAASRVNAPIDWEHVAEEIEDLGKRERAELRSRLRTIIEHLLKLQHSPNQDPREGWTTTVRRCRIAAKDLMKDSPSLKPKLPDLLAEAQEGMGELVREELQGRDRLSEAEAARIGAEPLSEEQVLGDWLPPTPLPPSPPSRRHPAKR